MIAEEMRVSGSGRIDGRVEAKELKCSGTLRVSGAVVSEYVRITGSLRVGADVEAAIFRATGGFDIGGLLSADKVEVKLGGRCRAREIGGERIEIRRGSWLEKGLILDGLIKMFTGGGAAELRATQIEGPAYIQVLAVCPTGWRSPGEETIRLGRLAAESGVFPIYEVDNGEYTINVEPKDLRSMKEYLKLQGRFRHLKEEDIAYIEKRSLTNLKRLRAKAAMTQDSGSNEQ